MTFSFYVFTLNIVKYSCWHHFLYLSYKMNIQALFVFHKTFIVNSYQQNKSFFMLWFFNLWFNHKLSYQVLLELDMNVPNWENWLFCFVVSEMCLLYFGLHRLHVMNMFTCHVYVYSDSHNMFLMYSDLKKFYFARQCRWNSLLRLEKVCITPTSSEMFWKYSDREMVWITSTSNEMVWIYYDWDIVCVYSELIWKGLDLLQPWNGLDLLRV